MRQTYSQEFIDQALVKIHTRGTRTIRSVIEELNVNYHTVQNWQRRDKVKITAANSSKEKRPQDWSNAERLKALSESYHLSGEALNAWCRSQGIFPHNLTEWSQSFCQVSPNSKLDKDIRQIKEENTQLKRELYRKDKALSEAAALLVLQKKYQALWSDGEK
jgi:hypothetical protein